MSQGWAVFLKGKPFIDTVSISKKAAIVNWLWVHAKRVVLRNHTDKQIESMWVTEKGKYNVECLEVDVSLPHTIGEVHGFVYTRGDGMNFKMPSLDITIEESDDEATLGVRIREDGKVLWVNFGSKCVFRVCGIVNPIDIEDNRERYFTEEVEQ